MNASRFLIAGAVAALLQIGVASAQTPSPTDPPTHPTQPDSRETPTPSPSDPPTHPTQPKSDATFSSLDTDSDGRISKAEAEADAKVKQQFPMYDKNGNGFIEKDEVMTSEGAPPEPPKE